ncbi:MAG: hypothetical protein IH989_06430 [Planctomycetes bacterium]|nr:hypothetical protein [Planctomycetota bacterium]
MDDPNTPTLGDSSKPTPDASDLPPGRHALEVAARSGIGPLSPDGREVWHGRARPCVSCGQLILRDVVECEHCGQDHSMAMRKKMRLHAGPWYVLEHVRPFPGVSLERIIKQIRRGLIMETSIVRGPSTNHQWRFAAETPGLCRYFERCWRCHDRVSLTQPACRKCNAYLTFDPPTAKPEAASYVTRTSLTDPPVGSAKLAGLSAAVKQAQPPSGENLWDAPPRVGGIRATWIVAAALVLVMFVLLWVTQSRGATTPTSLDLAPSMQRSDARSPQEG